MAFIVKKSRFIFLNQKIAFNFAPFSKGVLKLDLRIFKDTEMSSAQAEIIPIEPRTGNAV